MNLFGTDDPPPQTTQPTGATAAYRVLARKYRPRAFDDMIGQDVLVRILRNAFALDRVPHAFMLTGVRGVGKTTTARIIARCLNCTGPDGSGGPTAEPCGVCANCVAILADRHPDVTEMDAASHTGVDDVREIIEATRFRPMQGRIRVFIIDEVHMLSRNAFNALLKTLEEPPPHVKFAFATTEIRKVPVTVLSRCMRFDLRRVSVAELSGHFARIAEAEQVHAEPEALALIARAADGSVRDGLSLLDQAIAQAEAGQAVTAAAVSHMLGLADRDMVFDLLEAVLAGQPQAALALTERAHAYGADLGMVLTDLLALVHTVTRLKSVPALRDSFELTEAERTRGAAIADGVGMAALGRAWQMLLKGIQEVEQAPDRRAAGEMILIRLCHVADLPPPGELVRQLVVPGRPSSSGAPAPRAPVGSPSNPRAGAHALARAIAAPEPLPAPSPDPRAATPRTLREIASLLAERREASLHAHLVQGAHLVRLAPPVIELRMEPHAPADFAARLAAALREATGTRWTVALSAIPGEPTLAQQAAAADSARRFVVAEHPLVRAILEAFPGAEIASVRDFSADAYGLAPEAAPADRAALAGEAGLEDGRAAEDFDPDAAVDNED